MLVEIILAVGCVAMKSEVEAVRYYLKLRVLQLTNLVFLRYYRVVGTFDNSASQAATQRLFSCTTTNFQLLNNNKIGARLFVLLDHRGDDITGTLLNMI